MTMDNRQNRLEALLWSGFGLLVLGYALIPVLWILSLSLKWPADLNDRNERK
jgi:trehalose/maltose transport system permease protein